MMLHRFNLRKSTQAVCRLLQNDGGQMSYMKVIKELYLTDREALSNWGCSVTGDNYFSMKHGPILSNVLDQINNKDEDPDSYWEKYIQQEAPYLISLVTGAEIEDDELSNREVKLLDEIHSKFKNYDKWKLVDYCHQFVPEWTDPGNSRSVIEIESILRNTGKDEEDIKHILSEISSANLAKMVFAG